MNNSINGALHVHLTLYFSFQRTYYPLQQSVKADAV